MFGVACGPYLDLFVDLKPLPEPRRPVEPKEPKSGNGPSALLRCLVAKQTTSPAAEMQLPPPR